MHIVLCHTINLGVMTMQLFPCGSLVTYNGWRAVQICRTDRRYYAVFSVKPAYQAMKPFLAIVDDFGVLVAANALHAD